jgi:Zn ribbon nucleic-acid-binding protein
MADCYACPVCVCNDVISVPITAQIAVCECRQCGTQFTLFRPDTEFAVRRRTDESSGASESSAE